MNSNGLIPDGDAASWREVDARIAAQIFSRRNIRFAYLQQSNSTEWFFESDSGESVSVPRFASDIGSTWEIVVELTSRGFKFSLEILSDGLAKARFTLDRLGPSGVYESPDGLLGSSEAICLAALNATSASKRD